MRIVHPKFCDPELILNKTGYSHIMENKKNIFFKHGNWLKKICHPLVFFNFLRNSSVFLEKNSVFLEALICDVLMVKSLLRVDPTQNYGENTKSSIQDFIDFAIKT